MTLCWIWELETASWVSKFWTLPSIWTSRISCPLPMKPRARGEWARSTAPTGRENLDPKRPNIIRSYPQEAGPATADDSSARFWSAHPPGNSAGHAAVGAAAQGVVAGLQCCGLRAKHHEIP